MKKYLCAVLVLLTLLVGCDAATQPNTTISPTANTTGKPTGTMIVRLTPSPSPAPTIRMIAESIPDMKQLIYENAALEYTQKTGMQPTFQKSNISIYKEMLIDDEYFIITDLQEPNQVKLALFIFEKKSDTEYHLKTVAKTQMYSGFQSMLYQIAYADFADRTIIFGLVGEVYLYPNDPAKQDWFDLHEEWKLRVTKMVMKIDNDAPMTMDTSENWGYLIFAKKGARVKELSVYAGTRELPRAATKNYVTPWPYQSEVAKIVNY